MANVVPEMMEPLNPAGNKRKKDKSKRLPGGGVYIDLEEMERKEAEKKAKEDEEAQAKEVQEAKDQRLDKINELKWAYNLYVLGSGPTIFAIITVAIGPFIQKVGEKCKQQPLDVFVILSIFLAYVYLFLYNWMLMGPVPFRGRMKPLKIIFAVYTLGAVIVYGLGAVFFSSGSACLDSAPMQYRFCQWQLIMFLVGICSSIYKFAQEAISKKMAQRRREQKAKMKQLLQQEMDQVEDEEDEDEEEEEDEDDEKKGDAKEQQEGETTNDETVKPQDQDQDQDKPMITRSDTNSSTNDVAHDDKPQT